MPMHTQTDNQQATQAQGKKGTSIAAAIGGLAVGLAISGATFWAGYETHKNETVIAQAVPTTGGLSATAPAQTGNQLVLGGGSLAEIAAEAMTSVVNIDTRSKVALAEPFADYFNMPGQQRSFESHGAGSGVVLRSDGYILTNNHVVKDADEIMVTLPDKRKFTGKVVGKDAFTDLALVKIEARDLKAASLGTSKSLRPGDWAIAIGSPLGLSQTVTLGIISAIGRSINNLNSVELIQTDAAINPGNSGGPLLNAQGEVIGINTAIRGDGQNIGFAIPIDVARQIAGELISRGSVPHSYLGIAMQDMDQKIAGYLGVSPDTRGVIVAKAEPDSPAGRAGIKHGDLIERIDGKPVASGKEVQAIVRAHKPGETLKFLVLRDQQVIPVDVTIGDYADVKEPQARPSRRSQQKLPGFNVEPGDSDE